MAESLNGTGMGEAAQAFQATMDAEQPTRSKSSKSEKREPERMDMDDIFPSREMDRREREGGADDEPEIVRRRRAEANGGRTTAPADAADADEPELPFEEEEQPQNEDEPDTEPEEEEDDEQDEESAGPIDLDQIVTVTIDGEPAEVSLKEALRGYIRTETFHRRLGDLQQGVTVLNTARQEVDTIRQAYLEQATLLNEYVTAFMPQEPNWDALYEQDPGNASRIERNWRSFLEKVGGLRSNLENARAEATAEQQRNLHLYAGQERAKLAHAHQEWKNEKVWQRDHDSMRRTARAAGYTDSEINQLYDARGVEILLKAAKYDRMMATKPKPVRGAVNPTNGKGTTPPRRAVSRSFDRAEKRLSRTGSIQDAADAFERILDNGG